MRLLSRSALLTEVHLELIFIAKCLFIASTNCWKEQVLQYYAYSEESVASLQHLDMEPASYTHWQQVISLLQCRWICMSAVKVNLIWSDKCYSKTELAILLPKVNKQSHIFWLCFVPVLEWEGATT